jgi:hypothetical protein
MGSAPGRSVPATVSCRTEDFRNAAWPAPTARKALDTTGNADTLTTLGPDGNGNKGAGMRTIARITIPVESGNRAIQDGTIGRIIQQAAEQWKPEAMYFTTFDGKRTTFIVFDLPDASDIPAFAEPFFSKLNAEVLLAPAMNGDDLQKGLSRLG